MNLAIALAAIFGALTVVLIAFALYNAWDLWNRRDEDKAPATGFGDSE